MSGGYLKTFGVSAMATLLGVARASRIMTWRGGHRGVAKPTESGWQISMDSAASKGFAFDVATRATGNKKPVGVAA